MASSRCIFAEEAKREGYARCAPSRIAARPPKTIEELPTMSPGSMSASWAKSFGVFQRAGVTEAVMAGAFAKLSCSAIFVPICAARDFWPSSKAAKMTLLLRGIADELAADGIKVFESTLCLPHIIAAEGVLTKRAPDGTSGTISSWVFDRQGDWPLGHWSNRRGEESHGGRRGSGGRNRCGDCSAADAWPSPAVWS